MEAAERRERTPARPRGCKASCIAALVPLCGVLPVLSNCMGLRVVRSRCNNAAADTSGLPMPMTAPPSLFMDISCDNLVEELGLLLPGLTELCSIALLGGQRAAGTAKRAPRARRMVPQLGCIPNGARWSRALCTR